MNIELYKEMLSIRSISYSTEQIRFREWIIDYISQKNYKNTTFETDTYGNLYVKKGNAKNFNCVVAHLDINQKACADFSIVTNEQWITGINNSTGKQIGLGHDDKIGVYFALQMLDRFKNLKCFFPLDEEVGCVGTGKSDDSFFDNVGFMVQLDRRGHSDISQSTNGIEVVTEATKTQLMPILTEYGFHWEDCMFTDVGELVGMNDKQGVNISCGYYNEHSDTEILNIDQYMNSEAFAFEILKKVQGTIYNIQPVSIWGNYGNYGGGSYKKSSGSKYTGGVDSRIYMDGYDDDFYEDAYGYSEDIMFPDNYPSKKKLEGDEGKPDISANNYDAIKNYYYETVSRICNDIKLSDLEVMDKLRQTKSDVEEIEAVLLMDLSVLVEYIDDRVERFEALIKKWAKDDVDYIDKHF